MREIKKEEINPLLLNEDDERFFLFEGEKKMIISFSREGNPGVFLDAIEGEKIEPIEVLSEEGEIYFGKSYPLDLDLEERNEETLRLIQEEPLKFYKAVEEFLTKHPEKKNSKEGVSFEDFFKR